MIGVECFFFTLEQLEASGQAFRPAWDPSAEVPLESEEQKEFMELTRRHPDEFRFLDPYDLEKWVSQFLPKSPGVLPPFPDEGMIAEAYRTGWRQDRSR